ncbi:MAG: M48 family metalloprotease, partial [Bacteroidales bacterium]|nr:M48 family metalloprotease [Bacteroidales bacterium]
MESLFYIIKSAIYISLFYLGISFLKNRISYVQQRFLWIAVLIISLILPAFNYSISISGLFEADEIVAELNFENNEAVVTNETTLVQATPVTGEQTSPEFNWNILLITYRFGAILLLLWLTFQLIYLTIIRLRSKVYLMDDCTIIHNKRFKTPFSFLHRIYMNDETINSDEFHAVLAHEKAHVQQWHTLDVLLVELVTAIMWFNPFVWLLRRDMRQNHEYLADDAVVENGMKQTDYQTILLNFLAEERLLPLSNGFTPALAGKNSLIKKRIIMMTKKKATKKWFYSFSVFTGITLLVCVLHSCIDKPMDNSVQEKEGKAAESTSHGVVIAVEKMNLFYVAVDNPISIAVDGISNDELEVQISNATIEGSNGEYLVKPKRPGNCIITVMHKGEVIDKKEYRVKILPNPRAQLAECNKNGGV